MVETTATWREKRRRVLWLVLLVLAVEVLGLAFGLPAALLNILRFGEVWFAVRMGLASSAALRRWGAALAVLTILEVVLAAAGAYVGLVWVLRIFLYPQALLFTTPRGVPVRFAWVWAAVLGVMVLAFLNEKAMASGGGAEIWITRGLLAAAAAVALVFWERVYLALTSLKFAAVNLVLLTILAMLGTLVVQRPPVDPNEYGEKFAAGQVGFLVNAEVLLGMAEIPEDALFDKRGEERAEELETAFGDQIAKKYRKEVRRYQKNQYVAGQTDRMIDRHRAEVRRLMGFMDDIFFTEMFQSWAFNSLLVLLVLSLLAVIVKKYPWGRYGWGPVATHAGIVMILLGCAISDITMKEGFVVMSPAGPRSLVRGFIDKRAGFNGSFRGEDGLDEALEEIRKRLDGSGYVEFRGKGESAEWEISSEGERWRLHRSHGAPVDGDVAREAVRGWEAGSYEARSWVELPFALRMTEGYVDYYRELRVTAGGVGGHGMPLEEGYPLLPGKGIPLFDGAYVAKILEVHPHARVTGLPSVTRERAIVLIVPGQDGPKSAEVPAVVGEKATIPGAPGNFEVEVLAFATNYAQHEQGVPLARQDESNPAVRVKVKDPSGEEQSVWIFEAFPQFYAQGAMGARNPKVRVNDMALQATGGGDATAPTVLGDADVTPIEVPVDEVPPAGLVPAVKISLSGTGADGKPFAETRWLLLAQKDTRRGTETLVPAGDPSGWIASPDGKVTLRMVETMQQSIYETHVDVLDRDGGKIESHVIRVNQPYVRKGFRLFQSTYDESRGAPQSGLTVKYDVAIPLIYAGFLVTMLGLVFAFYVLPPLRRRAEARKKEEFGKDVKMGMEF